MDDFFYGSALQTVARQLLKGRCIDPQRGVAAPSGRAKNTYQEAGPRAIL